MEANSTQLALIESIESSNTDQMKSALADLLKTPSSGQAVASILIGLVSSDDEQVIEQAVSILEDMGAPTADQWVQLPRLLSDYQANTRSSDEAYWTVTLMGRFQKAHPDQANLSELESLIQLLSTAPDDNVRERSAWAIGCWGKHATEFVPALEAELASASPRLERLIQRAIQSAE